MKEQSVSPRNSKLQVLVGNYYLALLASTTATQRYHRLIDI